MNEHFNGTWVDRAISETDSTFRSGPDFALRVERECGTRWRLVAPLVWGDYRPTVEADNLAGAKKLALEAALRKLQDLCRVVEAARQLLRSDGGRG